MTRYIELHLAGEPERILHADDDHTLVEIAVTVARDMALHGHLDESAAIVGPLWNFAASDRMGKLSFSLNFLRDTISRTGLELIWRGAKFTPNFYNWLSRFEELGYTEEQIEADQRDYFCVADDSVYDLLPDDPPSIARWRSIRDLLAVNVDTRSNACCLPGREAEIKALKLIQAYTAQTSPSAAEEPSHSRLYAMGLELALKYDNWDLAQKMLNAIGARIANLALSAARDVAQAPRIGTIVAKTSILEQITGLTRGRAQGISDDIVKSLDLRLESGEPRPYVDLSWASLLAEIEAKEAVLRDDEHEAVLPFLRPPANNEQIALAEAQLGIELPQDYKDFLAVSDGLGSYNLSQTTPLLSIDVIFWDTEHHELKVEYRRFEGSNPKTARLPSLDRVLQISEIDDEAAAHWWLIEPALVKDAKQCMGEGDSVAWLGVNYAEWNPTFSNRGSFRIMMERRLSILTRNTPM